MKTPVEQFQEQLNDNSYLGDGVYIGNDGYHVVLYTSDGIMPLNRVCLDEHVLKNLANYLGLKPKEAK